tara:strand:+ start:75 stop:422 length:348 start_codon:yes stop_codon:yes gene_type:complete
MKLDLYNPMVFYTILLLTAFVEMYGFYASKHSTFLYAIVAFVFVGLMHSVLFVSNGMVHTHALYNIITVVLVTLLGVYDNEKVTENKMIGIGFAILAIVFIEYDDLKKIVVPLIS